MPDGGLAGFHLGAHQRNAGDLCIRCHTPTGWLGGHSDPPNLTALAGSDFEGISCDACHKMTDPVRGLRQLDDLPAEAVSTAITEANKTYVQDLNVLNPLTLFDGTPFFNPATDYPTYYGDGGLPHYIESAGGQYFMDTTNPKRAPTSRSMIKPAAIPGFPASSPAPIK